MSLREARAAGGWSGYKPTCTLTIIRESMTPEDQETLDEWMADPDMPATEIAYYLNQEGYEITARSVQRHGRGGCTCEPR